MADAARAIYTFLPYVRQGLAAAIGARPGDASDRPSEDGRLSMPVRLRVNNRQDSGSPVPLPDDIAVPLRLYGPGDVIGVDPREVVRTEPRNLIPDFSPHFFPAIEFDRPDLPWMFTPEHPDDAGRLRPWLCLAVVRQSTGTTLTSDAGHPLPVLRCPRGELPDLAESWAWAHAQVARAAVDGMDGARAEIGRVLAAVPQQNVSRLLCPRHLEPNTAYLACLVPTFEAGRLAGLGETVTAESLKGLRPAWHAADEASRHDTVSLPVYYHWELSTGGGGDSFESLVRRLVVRTHMPGVGSRLLDVSEPGWGMPRLAKNELGAVVVLEGALRPASQEDAAQRGPIETPSVASSPLWPASASGPFKQRLREVLNAPALRPSANPLMAPPIYGQLHAGRGIVPAPGGKPFWLEELNLDPRHRVAAGLGTLVVRYQQEELMAAAWVQVEEVERANQRRRQAQLAREVGNKIHERLQTLSSNAFLQVTAPAHSAVPAEVADTGTAGFGTVASTQRATATPAHADAEATDVAVPTDGSPPDLTAATVAAVSPAFRRLVRPRGPMGRRVTASGEGGELRLVRRLAENPLSAVAQRKPEAGMTSLGELARTVLSASSTPQANRLGAGQQPAGRSLEQTLLKAVRATVLPTAPSAAPQRLLAPAAGATAKVFRQAAIAKQTQMTKTAGGPAAAPPAVSIESVAARLAARLDPSVAVVQAVHEDLRRDAARMAAASTQSRAAGSPRRAMTTAPEAKAGEATSAAGAAEARDPLDAVMSAPTFPQPMYEHLRDYHDMLLPGLENVPADTIALLALNAGFIEAFMVGLNHEMGRELLWREYPTDQRGTYFRQFWDVRGTDRSAEDIAPIHTWSDEDHLGDNFVRQTVTAARAQGSEPVDRLVLLIRGELLRRSPNAVIYAVKALSTGAFPAPADPVERKQPLFRGAREPDVVFIGFDLTADEARGTAAGGDAAAGWYFVLEEQPTEPRFGLDPAEQFGLAPTDLTQWRDLSWGHLAASAAAFASMTHASLAGPMQGKSLPASAGAPTALTWGANAGHMARITLQRAYRVAIHASAMLPPASSQ